MTGCGLDNICVSFSLAAIVEPAFCDYVLDDLVACFAGMFYLVLNWLGEWFLLVFGEQ